MKDPGPSCLSTQPYHHSKTREDKLAGLGEGWAEAAHQATHRKILRYSSSVALRVVESYSQHGREKSYPRWTWLYFECKMLAIDPCVKGLIHSPLYYGEVLESLGDSKRQSVRKWGHTGGEPFKALWDPMSFITDWSGLQPPRGVSCKSLNKRDEWYDFGAPGRSKPSDRIWDSLEA